MNNDLNKEKNMEAFEKEYADRLGITVEEYRKLKESELKRFDENFEAVIKNGVPYDAAISDEEKHTTR